MKKLKTITLTAVLAVIIVCAIFPLTVYAANFTISETNITMNVGDMHPITIHAVDMNDTFTSKTNATHVATINANNVITAHADGEAEITFTNQDGSYIQMCVVKVGTGLSTTYSLMIVIIEAVIIIAIAVAFVISYRKFLAARVLAEIEREGNN